MDYTKSNASVAKDNKQERNLIYNQISRIIKCRPSLHQITLISVLVCCFCLPCTTATFFNYKYDKKQELLDHFKGSRNVDNNANGYGKFHNGGFFGFTGYENLFRHAYPLAYHHVPKVVAIPHPVPVTVERPIPIPVPVHVGRALGEYSPPGYETALANYAAIMQQPHSSSYPQHHHSQQRQPQQFYHSSGTGYDHQQAQCHPYCDINLPQGSSPVPLISKEKRMLRLRKKQKKSTDRK